MYKSCKELITKISQTAHQYHYIGAQSPLAHTCNMEAHPMILGLLKHSLVSHSKCTMGSPCGYIQTSWKKTPETVPATCKGFRPLCVQYNEYLLQSSQVNALTKVLVPKGFAQAFLDLSSCSHQVSHILVEKRCPSYYQKPSSSSDVQLGHISPVLIGDPHHCFLYTNLPYASRRKCTYCCFLVHQPALCQLMKMRLAIEQHLLPMLQTPFHIYTSHPYTKARYKHNTQNY